MIRHIILPLLLTCLVVVAGFGRADDDQDVKKENPDAPPPRLKRKKRPGAVEVKPPVKDDKDKVKDEDRDKKDKKGKDKAKADMDEPIIPEDGMPGEPEEDEAEILERVNRNMRAVEEKLGNREVGDPTQQQQRDILKDLDSLIRKSQQQEQGGGGAADQQPQGGMDEKQGENEQGGVQKQRQQRGGQKMASSKGQRKQRQPRKGNRMMAGGPKQGQGQGKGQGRGQQPGKGLGGGQNPGQGRGGDGPRNDKELDNKLYKDVWGHLPESLRAEMNAYSNPRPFMPRYDDLIKKYYRTIAEKGRSKGD